MNGTDVGKAVEVELSVHRKSFEGMGIDEVRSLYQGSNPSAPREEMIEHLMSEIIAANTPMSFASLIKDTGPE